MKKFDLNIEQIVELYTKEKMSFNKIAKIFKVNASTIARAYKKAGYVVRNNHEKTQKYSCNFDYFEKIDTAEKAYWLGFIYADGYITKNKYSKIFGIKLKKTDKQHILTFQKNIKSNHKIEEGITNNNFGTCEFVRLAIVSEKLVNDLTNKGVLFNKSLTLQFPTYEQVPKKFIFDFIRGYFDGDGSIWIRKNSKCNTISFVGTFEFLTELNKILTNNQGKLYKEKRSKNIITIPGQTIYKKGNYLQFPRGECR